MAKISATTLPSMQFSQNDIVTPAAQQPAAPVAPVAVKSWLDCLPHGCELPDLWRTGKSLPDCLDLIDRTQKEQDKTCRATCRTTCQRCHDRWGDAARTLILQTQLKMAAGGNSQLLQWVGKAILRQTEPIPDNKSVFPAAVTIGGLDINQEDEIDDLRKQLKDALQKIKELTPKEAETQEDDSDGSTPGPAS